MAKPAPRFKDVNFGQLRVFCEFLRHKTFADAARALGVSHSAVWQQVRALERRFGVSLLQRHGRAWGPTEDGLALLDLIAPLLHGADALDDAFRRLRRDLPRELRVTAGVATMSGELAGPLAELARRHPDLRVRLSIVSTRDQVLEDLLAGDADVAFLNDSFLGDARRNSVEVVPVGERPPGALVPARHPLARRPRPTLDELAAHPLILPGPEFPWRQRCDEAFRAAGLRDGLRVPVEVTPIHAIEELVRRGVGVGVAPFVAGWRPGAGLRVLPAGHLFPGDRLLLLRRRGKPRPQVALLEELLLRG